MAEPNLNESDPPPASPRNKLEDSSVDDATPRASAELPTDMLRKLRINIPGYRLLSVIGRGGQAIVFKAVREATGQIVAVKLLKGGPVTAPNARERFEREVRALSAIKHPNIVGILDTGQTRNGHGFLVMHYITGQSLRQLMDDARFLSESSTDPEAMLVLFKKICDAVAAAHMNGITHRDLSPSNVIVDEAGEPHIVDFGLARTAFDKFMTADRREITVTGQFLGKLAYASPEQAQGQGDIDIRTDVYALGVILYQIITGGRYPYEVVGNIADVLNNIVNKQPTPPSVVTRPEWSESLSALSVNPVIEAIVMKALEKDRAVRYQSAGELAMDIGNYLAGLPTIATVARTGKHGGRRRVVSWAAAACLLLLAGAAWIWSSREDDKPTTAQLTSLDTPKQAKPDARSIPSTEESSPSDTPKPESPEMDKPRSVVTEPKKSDIKTSIKRYTSDTSQGKAAAEKDSNASRAVAPPPSETTESSTTESSREADTSKEFRSRPNRRSESPETEAEQESTKPPLEDEKKSNNDTNDRPSSTQKNKSRKSDNPSQPPSKTESTTPNGKMIDLLANRKPQGGWTLTKDGGVESNSARGNNYLFGKAPRSEFDLLIEFTLKQRFEHGQWMGLALFFKDSRFSWAAGFKQSPGNTCGFARINKQPFFKNNSSREYEFFPNTKYKVVLQIRNSGLKAIINDELINEHATTDYQDMSKWWTDTKDDLELKTPVPMILHAATLTIVSGSDSQDVKSQPKRAKPRETWQPRNRRGGRRQQ